MISRGILNNGGFDIVRMNYNGNSNENDNNNNNNNDIKK